MFIGRLDIVGASLGVKRTEVVCTLKPGEGRDRLRGIRVKLETANRQREDDMTCGYPRLNILRSQSSSDRLSSTFFGVQTSTKNAQLVVSSIERNHMRSYITSSITSISSTASTSFTTYCPFIYPPSFMVDVLTFWKCWIIII